MPLGTVRDIMTKSLVTAKPDTSVKHVVELMRERNVGSVLVVDESGKLVGIFTERDLVKLVAEGKSLDVPVKEVMTTKLVVAHESDSIASIANKMIENWIRHIPVVDEQGRPIGIVSIRDVLRHIVASSAFP